MIFRKACLERKDQIDNFYFIKSFRLSSVPLNGDTLYAERSLEQEAFLELQIVNPAKQVQI